MNTHLNFLIVFLLIGGVASADTVVTSNERIAGTITSKTKSSVTIKIQGGNERTIERDRIVQILGDDGKVLYTSPALVTATNHSKLPEAIAMSEPGDHKHDGLYLRLLLGLGNMKFRENPIYSNSTGSFEASGATGFFGLHLGYAVFENLILYGAVNGYSLSNPEYSINGVKTPVRVDNSIGVSNYGGGLAIYIPAVNAYLNADIGTATTKLTTSNGNATSRPGIGVNVQLGKEWWMSKNWGFGAALFYHYSSMDDEVTAGVVPRITNSIFGLAISATYN